MKKIMVHLTNGENVILQDVDIINLIKNITDSHSSVAPSFLTINNVIFVISNISYISKVPNDK